MRGGCALSTLPRASFLTAALPTAAATPSSAPPKASVHGCASTLGNRREASVGCLRQFQSIPQASFPIAISATQTGGDTTGKSPRAAIEFNVSGNTRTVADVEPVAAGFVRVVKGAPSARLAAVFCAGVGLFTVAVHEVVVTLDRTAFRTTLSLAILLGVLATSISTSQHLASLPKARVR